MTWELVAQIVILMVATVILSALMMAIVSANRDAKVKRDIQLYEAGLMPKGWKKP